MNPVLEGRRKMLELFDKIEFTLIENSKVISKLPVTTKKKDNVING